MSRVIQTVGIRGLRVTRSEQKAQFVEVSVSLVGQKRPACPECQHSQPWVHGQCIRTVRHLDALGKRCWLKVQHPRYRCPKCGKTFNPPLPGILPGKQASEPFRGEVAQLHHDGISTSALAGRVNIGSATVERIYQHFNQRKAAERISLQCPQILGIDEHTIHGKQRFATTFCDLRNHKVFDVVEGKSQPSLESFLKCLLGRDKVRVVCIDLSSSYRSLIERYFPQAKIVADRFHVVKLVTYHFMNLARQITPAIKYQRGILNLLRMNPKNLTIEQNEQLNDWLKNQPVMAILYQEMQALRALMNHKHQNAKACKGLARKLLDFIERLSTSGFENMKTLAQTLQSWIDPIARMWRFTKNNGITEGFHRKMKLIQRRAYGFRNFQNYRIRVIAQCG
jgi:transposase